MPGPRNVIPLANGNVRFVCQFCGRKTGPRLSARFSDLPNHWSIAPLPDTVRNGDGSYGATYTCPLCSKRTDYPLSPVLDR